MQKHQSLINKLKKQVSLLRKKEEKNRKQLRVALKKAQHLGKTYKTKLAGKLRKMQDIMEHKISEAQSSTYAKVASDIEHQLLKAIKAKAKILSNVVSELEKKHVVKIKKPVAKKSKHKKHQSKSSVKK